MDWHVFHCRFFRNSLRLAFDYSFNQIDSLDDIYTADKCWEKILTQKRWAKRISGNFLLTPRFLQMLINNKDRILLGILWYHINSSAHVLLVKIFLWCDNKSFHGRYILTLSSMCFLFSRVLVKNLYLYRIV